MTEKSFAISVVGRDQPGIIAAISKVLFELDCNLADTSMSILSNHFAMVLIAQTSFEMTEARLQRDISVATTPFDLVVSIQAMDSDEFKPRELKQTDHLAMVSVYGVDKPGIVHQITSAIAETDSNIVNLITQQGSAHLPPAREPFYSMFLEIELNTGEAKETLRKRLQTVSRDFEVEVTLQDTVAAEL